MVLIKSRNFLRGLRRQTTIDEGKGKSEQQRYSATISMRRRQSDCAVVRRIIKRRGMIKWVIDSNGGQRVEWPVSSSVACGQIRLAYPSLSSSSSWSSSEIASFLASFSEMRDVPFFLPCVLLCQWSFFEDYTCDSYHGVEYQPTRKTQAFQGKDSDFNLRLSSPYLIYMLRS